MHKVKMLSRTDEKILLQRAKDGCTKSMHRLHKAFLPMIEAACRKKGILQKESIEDVSQEMYFSLVTAVQKFDLEKKLGFSCYFRHYLKDTILKYIRRNSSFLYVGDGAKNKRIQNNFHRLYAQQAAHGTSSEEIYQNISRELRVSVEHVQDFHAATNLENFFCADHEDGTYASYLVSAEQPEEIACQAQREKRIAEVFFRSAQEYDGLDFPLSSTYLMDVLKKSITLKICAEMNGITPKSAKRCLDAYIEIVKKNTTDVREILEM